jgi:hypothetical protein
VPSKRGRGRPATHGLGTLKKSLTVLGTRRLDGRSTVAVAVRRWKEDVRRDRGGDLTRAQETILESAAQKLIIRDSLADFIARQPSLANRRRQVAPVVLSFLQVSDSLTRDLERLGLDRKTKDADLDSYLVELEQEKQRKAEAATAPIVEQEEEADADHPHKSK